MDDYSKLMEAFERLMLAASPFADDGTSAGDDVEYAMEDACSAWCSVENPGRELNVAELKRKHESEVL